MTVFAMRDQDSLMAVRFAISQAWETQAALQSLTDERGPTYHQPWLTRVQTAAAGLDLAPLLAALPRRGYVPDFLAPPPTTSRPRWSQQLAQVRATSPEQVARELHRCRQTVPDGRRRRLLTGLLADPQRACNHLAVRLADAWTSLIAPYWTRIRTLLEHDIGQRSRALARHGLRRTLDELHAKTRWTTHGLHLADGCDVAVEVDERGLLLMPSAYLWPHVATITEPPWLPASSIRAPGSRTSGTARHRRRTRSAGYLVRAAPASSLAWTSHCPPPRSSPSPDSARPASPPTSSPFAMPASCRAPGTATRFAITAPNSAPHFSMLRLGIGTFTDKAGQLEAMATQTRKFVA